MASIVVEPFRVIAGSVRFSRATSNNQTPCFGIGVDQVFVVADDDCLGRTMFTRRARQGRSWLCLMLRFEYIDVSEASSWISSIGDGGVGVTVSSKSTGDHGHEKESSGTMIVLMVELFVDSSDARAFALVACDAVSIRI